MPLRPVWHVSAFLGTTDIPVFEIRDAAGPATDLLIRTPYLGEALARSLRNAPVVLMRGHGSTTVGASVKQAVYRAVYAEMNARVQREAMQMGEVNFLTSEEAATGAVFMDSEQSMSKPWELWVQRVRSADGSRG